MSEPKSKIKDVTEHPNGTTARLLQAHLRANNDSQSWVQTPQIPSTAVGEELTPQSLRGQTSVVSEEATISLRELWGYANNVTQTLDNDTAPEVYFLAPRTRIGEQRTPDCDYSNAEIWVGQPHLIEQTWETLSKNHEWFNLYLGGTKVVTVQDLLGKSRLRGLETSELLLKANSVIL